MFRGRAPRHQLTRWMEREGNWRFKALLAAEHPESPYRQEDIGKALLSLAENPETKQRHLAKRPDSAWTQPAVRTLRVADFETQEYSTGPSSSAPYKEPEYARELLGDSKVEQYLDLDQYMGRMLVDEQTSEKDILWREQLLDTIVAGAEENKVARDASFVVDVDTKKGDHPIREDELFAPQIAEGAEIPTDEIDWTQQSWSAQKHGLGARVTDELMRQSLIDVMELNIRNLGAAMENALNRDYINEVVDNADSGNDHEVNPSNREVDVDDINRLMTEVEEQALGPSDTLVIHPKAKQGLLTQESNNNLVFVNRSDSRDVLYGRNIPEILDLDTAVSLRSNVYTGSNTWDWTATGEFGAVAYVRQQMFTYLYRDLETKDFSDPIRDLEGANVRGWWDTKVGNSSAFARMSH